MTMKKREEVIPITLQESWWFSYQGIPHTKQCYIAIGKYRKMITWKLFWSPKAKRKNWRKSKYFPILQKYSSNSANQFSLCNVKGNCHGGKYCIDVKHNSPLLKCRRIREYPEVMNNLMQKIRISYYMTMLLALSVTSPPASRQTEPVSFYLCLHLNQFCNQPIHSVVPLTDHLVTSPAEPISIHNRLSVMKQKK